MSPRIANTDQSQFLNGWKEIANYLGKGVRTVQRYESRFGLPVRRPSGKSEGAVMATLAEIDVWVSTRQMRDFSIVERSRKGPSRAELHALTKNLAEMKQLRLQTSELRSALHQTLERLHATIRRNATRSD